MRGAGIYGGTAPAGVGASKEEFSRAMDAAAARREAENEAYRAAAEAREAAQYEADCDEAELEAE